MKLTTRWQLWDLKRDIKRYESKVKFLKLLVKHIKMEVKKHDRR